MRYLSLLTLAFLMTATLPIFAQDTRIQVDFPPMMQDHMMANMRDHLLALQIITQQLSSQQFDAAADTAEHRLGMSAMDSHGSSHMGKLMPKGMAIIGTNMHHAASRFALAAKDAEIDGGLEKAFGALSEVMQQCVACHTGYKIHR
jgi:mono/diheme cytochrome c family protein